MTTPTPGERWVDAPDGADYTAHAVWEDVTPTPSTLIVTIEQDRAAWHAADATGSMRGDAVWRRVYLANLGIELA